MIEEATEKLALLLKGRVPESLDTGGVANENERELAIMLNLLFSFVQEMHEFIHPLSKGTLDDVPVPRPRNFLASPLKELHSRLQHLKWQAKQVAQGDFSQRVDFMGEFSEAFNFMVVSLANSEESLKRKIDQLEEALSHIATLEGLLPICSYCKKIRVEGGDPEDDDSWVEMESYIGKRTKARFSHSICPSCMAKYYPDFTY